MTLADFERSLTRSVPPDGLSPALRALWWARRDWERAHAIVMDDAGADAAWVHAHLHRREGDLANARYWYGQARQAVAVADLEAEWRGIAAALLVCA